MTTPEMTTPDLIDAARAIAHRDGVNDATAIHKGWRTTEDDDYHHPGDEIGRLMCDAYDAVGPRGAVRVLDAYLITYNAERRNAGLPQIERETLRRTLGYAASIRATPDQIAEMRDAW